MTPFFIAEIGINHFGKLEKAILMIKEAHKAGATAVKFQKYNPVKVLGKDSPYLKDAHQLTYSELVFLSDFAHRLGLQFGCSVFDVNDIPIINKLVDFHKIATRMNSNQEFIAKTEQCKKPVYMSIQPNTSVKKNYSRFKLMWCIPEYPSFKEDILKYPYQGFGLSSHCPDYTASVEAAKLGATVFENHVCLSKEDTGCDIPASINFDDYKRMTNEIKSLA